MTARTKGDIFIVAVLLALALFTVRFSVRVTGSGGLGAVSVPVFPILTIAGACVLYGLRRSKLTTRSQLILWALWAAVGTFLLVVGR